MNLLIRKIFKFLSSLRFAVINLIGLALLSAVGSFLESSYDQHFARVFVYQSWWMRMALGSLSLNLLAVLADRWPWKKRHLSFITAHFGILILIAGSFLTQIKGVDGSLKLGFGETGRSILLPSELLAVYASFDGDKIVKIHQSSPVFLKQTPSIEKPYTVSLSESSLIKVVDYTPYALSRVVYPPDSDSGLLVRFRLSGKRASAEHSIYYKKRQPFARKAVGRAFVVISEKKSYTPREENEIILTPMNGGFSYTLRSKGVLKKTGFIKKGEKIKSGWMDLDFHLLDFYKAREEIRVVRKQKPSPDTTSAIKVIWKNQAKWAVLNSFIYFYEEDRVYMLGYLNQLRSLGFPLTLNDFKIKRYPGSLKAKEYESLVTVDEGKQQVISMNEPLYYKGWTFYQSSFEEDERGRVISSIFSVNKDPGRWIKYTGSFLIVIGIFCLFYLRPKKNKSLTRGRSL